MPLIVAVSGKLGSGKDYIIENYLIPALNDLGLRKTTRMAFADQIKINVASRHNVDIGKCLSGDKSPELRRMLQIEGTEEGRNKYGEHIWTRTLDNWITLRTMRDDIDVVFVTDCRFPNEAQWVDRKGGLLIRINAPKRNNERLDRESHSDPDIRHSIASHSSETALDTYNFKYLIDNDPEHQSGVKDQVLNIMYDWLGL